MSVVDRAELRHVDVGAQTLIEDSLPDDDPQGASAAAGAKVEVSVHFGRARLPAGLLLEPTERQAIGRIRRRLKADGSLIAAEPGLVDVDQYRLLLVRIVV